MAGRSKLLEYMVALCFGAGLGTARAVKGYMGGILLRDNMRWRKRRGEGVNSNSAGIPRASFKPLMAIALESPSSSISNLRFFLDTCYEAGRTPPGRLNGDYRSFPGYQSMPSQCHSMLPCAVPGMRRALAETHENSLVTDACDPETNLAKTHAENHKSSIKRCSGVEMMRRGIP
ncbi:hypothetical protein C7212DRAFT_348892 [Tuber magnatum]|uniref:Uncharacterized protein n=1 Tax=Tuber magnatum TaxID=42249 RepID=A0A317SEY2_9PEZI|nr:hypothetical protein C7212DRAFT_348892 [Tuber magnatum]